ncbi:MAG: Crp/Fnr family transcriptional regulator [Bacteroidales bacterium]|nr:Crp/Fnr family transcriptional regulator [Bacteroidales bacterium]
MELSSAFVEQLEKLKIISDQEIEKVLSYFILEKLNPNDFFLNLGERCYSLGFLEKGILRTFIHDSDGNEIVKYFIDDNILFTDIRSYEDSKPAQINIQAITSCQILTIKKQENNKLKLKVPKWENVLNILATKSLTQMIDKQNFLHMGSAIEKYQYFIKHFPNLAQNVPLKYISSYLGITQSSLSRIRNQWK